MKKIESFGVVPLIRQGDEWRVLLIVHREGNHWGFPKGRPNPGETPLDSATRELKEETNLTIKELLHPTPFVEHYEFPRKRERICKTVHYFPAVVEGDLKLQEAEIRGSKWCSFADAIKQLSFKEARHILHEIMRLLKVE